MTPKQLVTLWVEYFNNADHDALAELYADDAVNHQMPLEAITGRENIRAMFKREFAAAEMICIPIQILQDGDWAVLEWRDPKGLQGCGFFQVQNDKIVMQRGYWDRLSFEKLHGQ